MVIDRVIELARIAHQTHWKLTGSESEGDHRAARVTKHWQDAVLLEFSPQFRAEFQAAAHLSEKIDLVDTERGVAYELKASPNNPHMEFYRDVFKVIAAKRHVLPALSAFVFLVPQKSAERMRGGLGAETMKFAKEHGIDCRVVDL